MKETWIVNTVVRLLIAFLTRMKKVRSSKASISNVSPKKIVDGSSFPVDGSFSLVDDSFSLVDDSSFPVDDSFSPLDVVLRVQLLTQKSHAFYLSINDKNFISPFLIYVNRSIQSCWLTRFLYFNSRIPSNNF
ncbi:hypothetical protein MED121_17359 [Marinomonas sp. MED121]|uniref:hypothetical protein n=1 Tax=Marinomonas sp. MED121 TaxID=314277 RepID=UPI00006910CE|nr:hypothetical protein [Marinomonas sp. MED121]EAQ67717.1 hypothetical protein MED121_17359 [Marinomonas sp. MED121]